MVVIVVGCCVRLGCLGRFGCCGIIWLIVLLVVGFVVGCFLYGIICLWGCFWMCYVFKCMVSEGVLVCLWIFVFLFRYRLFWSWVGWIVLLVWFILGCLGLVCFGLGLLFGLVLVCVGWCWGCCVVLGIVGSRGILYLVCLVWGYGRCVWGYWFVFGLCLVVVWLGYWVSWMFCWFWWGWNWFGLGCFVVNCGYGLGLYFCWNSV